MRFYSYPVEEWLSFRTTNPIERLNKEFKRRTKSIEIVAGEQSCYNLITVIALRMKLTGKRTQLIFKNKFPGSKAIRNLHNQFDTALFPEYLKRFCLEERNNEYETIVNKSNLSYITFLNK
ncbi:MAG: transposase [Bacteriovorax sp.]